MYFVVFSDNADITLLAGDHFSHLVHRRFGTQHRGDRYHFARLEVFLHPMTGQCQACTRPCPSPLVKIRECRPDGDTVCGGSPPDTHAIVQRKTRKRLCHRRRVLQRRYWAAVRNAYDFARLLFGWRHPAPKNRTQFAA